MGGSVSLFSRRRFKKVKTDRQLWEATLKEEHVLRVIVEELWYRCRIRLWRINCPVGGKVRPNERGIPDLIGYIPTELSNGGLMFARNAADSPGWVHVRGALPLFIEVKRPGGRRRPEQHGFIEEAKFQGCVAFFAESWDDVERELKAANAWFPVAEKRPLS